MFSRLVITASHFPPLIRHSCSPAASVGCHTHSLTFTTTPIIPSPSHSRHHHHHHATHSSCIILTTSNTLTTTIIYFPHVPPHHSHHHTVTTTPPSSSLLPYFHHRPPPSPRYCHRFSLHYQQSWPRPGEVRGSAGGVGGSGRVVSHARSHQRSGSRCWEGHRPSRGDFTCSFFFLCVCMCQSWIDCLFVCLCLLSRVHTRELLFGPCLMRFLLTFTSALTYTNGWLAGWLLIVGGKTK